MFFPGKAAVCAVRSCRVSPQRRVKQPNAPGAVPATSRKGNIELGGRLEDKLPLESADFQGLCEFARGYMQVLPDCRCFFSRLLRFSM